MKICRFCLKPIENGQEVKELRSQEKCHLECWKENKETWISQIIEAILILFLGR